MRSSAHERCGGTRTNTIPFLTRYGRFSSVNQRKHNQEQTMKTASEKIPEGVKVFDRQKCRIFVDREPMLQSYAFDSERDWDQPIDQCVRTGAKEVLLHAV